MDNRNMHSAAALSGLALVSGLVCCLGLVGDSPSLMRSVAWARASGSAGGVQTTYYMGASGYALDVTAADEQGVETTAAHMMTFTDSACPHRESCDACADSASATILTTLIGVLMLALSLLSAHRRSHCDSVAHRRSAIVSSLAAVCALLHSVLSFTSACRDVAWEPTPWTGLNLLVFTCFLKTIVALIHFATPVYRRPPVTPLTSVLMPTATALPYGASSATVSKFAPAARFPAARAMERKPTTAARPAFPAFQPAPINRMVDPLLARVDPLYAAKMPDVGDDKIDLPPVRSAVDGHVTRESVAVGWERAAAQAAAAAALINFTVSRPAQAADFFGVDNWGMSQFLDAVDKNGIQQVLFDQTGSNLMAMDNDGGRHMVKVLGTEGPDILKTLREHAVQFSVQPIADPNPLMVAGNFLFNVAFTWLPLVFLGGFVIRLLSGFFNRGEGGEQGGGGPGGGMGGFGGGNNPMNMLQSKSKIQMEPNTGVNFTDVAGCDESKLELTEVVDFLKRPEKYTKVGANCPKGVLLEGPPGTGKTLLARACAGEAGVPFISTSGSEFVEMFTGVGASRIRNLFADAKKNAPCIIFIDEIDAIGRQRSGGGGFATNDEREQTLNQILTEMDGFEGNTGVIVIAATNRGDILDSALLRPGRFDRRVPVDLPDVKGRVEILKVHCRDKPLAPEVELASIANRTIGFSGASLANLMNEAAIMAARRSKEVITFDEIDYAIDRLTVGLEKRTGMSTDSRKKLVAYHEAGHAIMAALTPGYDFVAKVTIIPRSNGAGGFTLFTPSQDRMESGMYSLKYLKGQLAVALGGRLAEELVFGEEQITTGASNDLQQVRNIARAMVTQWGFSSGLAKMAWEMPDNGGNPFAPPPRASEEIEQVIDKEISTLVTDAYLHCKNTIETNRGLMDAVVQQLLEKETINGDELNDLIEEYTGTPALNLNPARLDQMPASA